MAAVWKQKKEDLLNEVKIYVCSSAAAVDRKHTVRHCGLQSIEQRLFRLTVAKSVGYARHVWP